MPYKLTQSHIISLAIAPRLKNPIALIKNIIDVINVRHAYILVLPVLWTYRFANKQIIDAISDRYSYIFIYKTYANVYLVLL
ncbi:hypothetical protein Deia_00352 [Candidatus Deianiraea vastatrix]|uniref:Uncharacterized protein n=1 Tax=Candidatus Deianiraea vastatrix TaxID=2163644 RepID=A0A5B8XCS6_9RICK|nr:hypothetical protein Deia_00352 [Candidatus Deianiraea vastatrix]